MSFIDLIYDLESPSEKKVWTPPTKENMYRKDDSSIQSHNFKKKSEIFDK